MEELLRKLKVLYVEDDLIHREELADYLSRRVGRLYLAENGDQGYEKFQSLQPDLVITDLRMPKLSGVDLAKKIRSINKTVPIIVLTALSDKETILDTVKVGIFDYVLKPVDVKALMEVIGRAVSTIAAMDSEFGQQYFEPESLNGLKTDLTSFIKKETGKGPMDIRFKTDESELEIILIGTLTKYELALLSNNQNENMVEYNRSVFFRDRASKVQALVAQHLNTSTLAFESVTVNVGTDQCTIRFIRQTRS